MQGKYGYFVLLAWTAARISGKFRLHQQANLHRIKLSETQGGSRAVNAVFLLRDTIRKPDFPVAARRGALPCVRRRSRAFLMSKTQGGVV